MNELNENIVASLVEKHAAQTEKASIERKRKLESRRAKKAERNARAAPTIGELVDECTNLLDDCSSVVVAIATTVERFKHMKNRHWKTFVRTIECVYDIESSDELPFDLDMFVIDDNGCRRWYEEDVVLCTECVIGDPYHEGHTHVNVFTIRR